jgi:DNA polymerase (family 10)
VDRHASTQPSRKTRPRTERQLTRDRASAIADDLSVYLRVAVPDASVRAVGALRRGHETVGAVELLAVCAEPARVLAALRHHPAITFIDEKSGVLRARLDSDHALVVTAVAPDERARALLATTGPAEHVARVAAAWRALPEGNEASLYRAAGFLPVPPELRDDPTALRKSPDLPRLVELDDIRGLVHCHTLYSDGSDSIEAMALGAEALGFSYLTITDHSPSAPNGGLSIDGLLHQWDEIARVQEHVAIRILRGAEADILGDGSLDLPDDVLAQLDIVIASIHNRHHQDAAAMTARLERALAHPIYKIWGHALGRLLLSRPPIAVDIDAVLDAAARSRVAIELNGDPRRLDLPSVLVPTARRRGLRFVVSADAHSVSALRNFRHAVTLARRGALTREDILNTLPVDDFLDAVRPSRGL